MYDHQMHVTISFYAEKHIEMLALIDKVRDKLREKVLTTEGRDTSEEISVRVGEHTKAEILVEFYDDGENEISEQEVRENRRV